MLQPLPARHVAYLPDRQQIYQYPMGPLLSVPRKVSIIMTLRWLLSGLQGQPRLIRQSRSCLTHMGIFPLTRYFSIQVRGRLRLQGSYPRLRTPSILRLRSSPLIYSGMRTETSTTLTRSWDIP